MKLKHSLFCVIFFSFQFVISQDYFSDNVISIGAYYYPEHWDEENWERDIRKIAATGFEFTHFAEFAWSMLEPEEGTFQFAWLDKAIEIAAQNNLKVIMCTPTPTPPAWLTDKHPEVLIVNENGTRLRHGTRLHVNGTHPVYKEYTERIILKLTEKYGNDKRIWGWQIDNEPHFRGNYDYSSHAQQEFKKWLKHKYSHIENLNKAWGNAFWSMNYNNFEQIRIPNEKETGSVNPHALLDFQRYTSDALASFIRFQSGILKENISAEQFITTNYAYYKFLPAVNPFKNRGDLDFASHTMYLINTFTNYPPGEHGFRLGSGMELAFSTEFAKSVNGITGIMELQPGQINWGQWNAQPLPGAVRMWIWHSFALGDQFICTYRFRQPVFGGEQYHKGIVEPDGVTLSRGGLEYVQSIKEIKNMLSNYQPNREVPGEILNRKTAFLWKHDNFLSLENTPHNSLWDTWEHYYTYYLILKSMGVPVTFIQEDQEFDPVEYPFMVAPAYEMIDQKLISKWKAYAQEGGHLIFSCRTGMKNNHGHVWKTRLQEPIWELIGGKVEYYDHLPPGKTGTIEMDNQSYPWNVWSDVITPYENTRILASHTDQFYKNTATVISKKIADGSVTYIGTWSTDGKLEKDVIQKIFTENGAKTLNLPPYAFTEWRDGFWVTVNYTSNEMKAPIHENSTIIYGSDIVKPAGVTVWITQ